MLSTFLLWPMSRLRELCMKFTMIQRRMTAAVQSSCMNVAFSCLSSREKVSFMTGGNVLPC